MTDLVSIGFQYTGGLKPMVDDVKLATNEVNKLDTAQSSLKRTEEQAEKVAGRLAMSLREKNNVLKATASGSKEAVRNAKLENLENRLLAQGINRDLIPALLKVQKENLQLEESTKAASQAQRGMRKASQASTKELRKNSVRLGQASIQFEQLANQIQGGGNALLAFSQQSADLGIVLGFPLLGAFAGIAGALVSFVAPAFMDSAEAVNELGKSTENLNSVFKRTQTGAFDLSQDILELSQASRQLAELRIAAAMAEAEKQFKSSGKALQDLIADVDALEGLFGVGDANFERFLTFFNDANLSVGGLTEILDDNSSQSLINTSSLGLLRDMVKEVKGEFKLGTEEAVNLSLAFSKIQAGTSPTVEEVESLSNVLSMVKNNTSNVSDSFRTLLSSMVPQIEAFVEANSIINQTDESIIKLTRSQQDLIDKLDPLSALIKEQKNEEKELKDILDLKLISEKEYNKLLSQSRGLFKERRDDLDGTTEAQKEANAVLKDAQRESDTYAQQLGTLLNKLDPLGAATRQFEVDQGVLNEAWFLGKITLSEYDIALEKLNANYKKQKGDITGLTKFQQDFAKLQEDITKGADRLGTSFRSSGNGIADAFAEASDVLLGFGDRMRELNEQQEKLNASKAAGINITQTQAELDSQVLSAQLSGISSLFGATKNMFDEQSSARKKMHQAELVFQTIEIGLALQKAVANAVTAVTNQGSGDPYTAFARVAAMTALMAGTLSQVGVAFSGSGGSAPSVAPAGTGTVFGDDSAQSESIANVLEDFDDIQLDQLAELKGIRQGLGTLSGAVNQVTRSIVSAGGLDTGFAEAGLGTQNASSPSAATLAGLAGAVFGPLSAVLSYAVTDVLDKLTGGLLSGLVQGIFGSTKTELVDSGIQFLSQSFADIIESGAVEANIFAVIKSTTKKAFGLIRSSDFSTELDPISQEFAEALGGIFVTMADTLVSAGEVLGITTKTFTNGVSKDLMESLEFLNLEAGGISLEGLSGDEIEKELSAFFSSMGDSMAEFLFPQLLQYQQINEGMFETVLRVTKETAIFNDSIKALGVSMSNSSAIGFGQAVIEAAGGLENFTDAFNTFYDEFFTEQEKAENTLRSITEVFATLGVELPGTMEEYRALVEETAAMGAAGADTLAILLEVSGAFAAMSETLSEVESSSREAARSFADITTLLNAIRTPSNTNILLDAGGSSESARNKLVEDFGSAGAFGESFLSFANNFLGAEESLEVASETLASTMSGLFFEVTGQVADTAAEQNLIGLKDLIRTGSTTSDDLVKFFADMINGTREVIDSQGNIVSEAVEGITSLDIESGLLTGLLQVQPALNDYITLLQQQEQALESATNALNNQEMDMTIQLLELQGKAQEALTLTRSRELEELRKLDEANRGMGLESNLADLQALIFLQEDYNTALEDSKTKTSEAYDALNEAVTAQVDVLQTLVNELESQRNRIQSALRQQDVTTFGGFDLAMKELENVLASVSDGSVSAEDLEGISALDLSTLTAGDTSGFGSLAEFNLSQARVTNSLRELDAVLGTAQSAEQDEIDKLNDQLKDAEEQRDTLLGIQEATLNLSALEEEISTRDEIFQIESGRLADLQLAQLGTLLTEEEQQRLNQSLEEAIGTLLTQISTLDTSKLAEIFTKMTEIATSINTIPTGLTNVFNDLKSSLDTIPEKMDELWLEKQDLIMVHTLLMETWKDSQLSSLSDIFTLLSSDEGSVVFDSLGIISELETLNATLRELTSNQWHQNRNTLPRIVDAAEYMKDSLINDDRRKVSLPNSHYSLLTRNAEASEYLVNSLINDDRRKVSLPNSHYSLLTRNAEASEYLVNSLINDDRRKVSLPNSHYNNQELLINEVRSLKEEVTQMAMDQKNIGEQSLRTNRENTEITKRMEINGIDINETSTT